MAVSRPGPGFGKHPNANQKEQKRKTIKQDKPFWYSLIAAVVIGIVYFVLHSLERKGIRLVRHELEYWIWLLWVFVMLLTAGMLAMHIPERAVTRRTLKISVVLICVVTVFLCYMQMSTSARNDFKCVRSVTAENGKTFLIMRSRVQVQQTVDEDNGTTESMDYTLYRVFEKKNGMFCDASYYDEEDHASEMIWLSNDPSASVSWEFTDTSLVLTTDGNCMEIGEDGTRLNRLEYPLNR